MTKNLVTAVCAQASTRLLRQTCPGQRVELSRIYTFDLEQAPDPVVVTLMTQIDNRFGQIRFVVSDKQLPVPTFEFLWDKEEDVDAVTTYLQSRGWRCRPSSADENMLVYSKASLRFILMLVQSVG